MDLLHSDELPVTGSLVSALVRSQFPQYGAWHVSPLSDSGSSNVLFALDAANGIDRVLVRLPRQTGGGATVQKEADRLPTIGAGLSAPTPVVLGVGESAFGYPETWSITSWLQGRRLRAPGGEHLGKDIAHFVTQLREVPIPDAAVGDDRLRWYRGESLAAMDDDFQEAAAACRSASLPLDLDRAVAVWADALAAAHPVSAETAWYHGDLLIENLLVDDEGRLAGVLDFGGLGVGDPTVDLIVAWEALDRAGRSALWSALDVDDAQIAVSRGWALLIAFITFPYYGATMPARCADRLIMAQAAIEGD